MRKCGAGLLAMEWLLALALFFFPSRLLADDCGRDKSRLEDCLRSTGYAQGISTTINVIGTVLVNGVAIQTLVLGTRTVTVKPGEKPPDPVNYRLNVITQDGRTSVEADSEEVLWIYASVACSDPAINTAALTSAISFSAAGVNANWLSLGQPTESGGYKAVAVSAVTPSPDAVLQPGGTTVNVYAPAEGSTLMGSVQLEIGLGDYEIEFT